MSSRRTTNLLVPGTRCCCRGCRFPMTDKTCALASLLTNGFYFNAIALAGTFFVAANHVAQAGWPVGMNGGVQWMEWNDQKSGYST